MKRMHYLFSQERNLEREQKFGGRKRKPQKAKGGGDLVSLLAVIPLVDPVAHSKHNISRDKRARKRDW